MSQRWEAARVTGSPPSSLGQTTRGFPDVWKVPPRNKNFTGREALLDRLHGGIEDQVTAVVPHALQGFGGVGKTQVAIEYAYRFRDSYDVVWWIPAEQPDYVRSALAQLAPKLGVPASTTTGTEDAANAVLDALRNGVPYSRWLLIFDNADEPEDLNEILPPGPGHVLITSRNHRWESVVDTVAVDVFPREESVAFFKKRMRRAIDEADAEKLAEALGDLPLALEQAAALQTETGMSPENYLRVLTESAAGLLSEGKPTEYPVSMTAAWSMSVAKLKEVLPEAMELLHCCAFFGSEPIPRAVFRPVKGPMRPAMADLLADPIRLSRAISRLGKFALVRIDTATGERTLQVHRLIQALLREELSPESQRQIQDEVHSLLAGAVPSDPRKPANWPRYDALLAHIGPARVAESNRDEVRNLAVSVVVYLSASGNYRALETLVETFLRRWVTDSGPDNLSVLKMQRVKGDLLRDMGRYDEAFELNQVTLSRLRQTVGDQDRETLILLNSIGADLRARGQFQAAKSHDADSVRRHQAALGHEDVRTLRAVNNLAIDYGLTSDYPGARTLLENALKMAQLSEEDVAKGTVLNLWTGLGRAVRLCGDYTEACDLGEDALAYGREQLDADHFRVLITQKDLAIAMLCAGERAEALDLARDVHARYVRIYGIDYPGTLSAALCLANALRVNNHINEAYELARDTMDRYPTMYGPSHPYNYGCMGNVALLQRVRGEVQAAFELNEKAYECLSRELGKDHHYTLSIAVNLASDLATLRDFQSACALGVETRQRLGRLLGERHPATLAAAANLAADLAQAGRKEEAELLRAETMKHYNTTLGLEHPDAVVAAEGRHLDLDFDPPPL